VNNIIFHTKLILIIVVYYWCLLLFFGSEIPHTLYYIIPSLLFSIYILFLLLNKDKIKKVSLVLLLFALSAILTGIYNKEIEIIASTVIFVAPFIFVNEFPFKLNTRILNIILLITVLLGGVIAYYIGVNNYGFLPGHSGANGIDPWWRISIFPKSTPTSTGFFALIIFIINYFESKISPSLFKKFILILCVYLILFSGSRTVYLVFLSVITYNFIRFELLKKILPFIIIIIPLVVLTSSAILTLSEIDFAKESVLRGRSFDDQKSLESLARFILWDNLISVYLNSPVFGVGDYDLVEYFPLSPSTSEMKWFSLLASNGVFILLFIIYLAKIYVKSVDKRQFKNIQLIILLIVGMAFYGSFYVPYNFIFFINIFAIDPFEINKYSNEYYYFNKF